MILLILSFVAGVLTVLAPCTLPLLPVIVGSSVTGELSKKKVFTITLSLAISIILFTFLLKVSTVFIYIPQIFWSILSGVIIIIFGIITVRPELWDSMLFVSKLNQSSNKLLADGYKKDNFWGNIIIGASLGPVFSSCSPTYFLILATVLPQSFFLGLIDLIAYTIGLSLALIIIAFAGQKLILKLGGISDTHGRWRRTLGLIFILLGILILFGFDKKIEANLLSNGLFDITRVEQSLISLNDKSLAGGNTSTTGEMVGDDIQTPDLTASKNIKKLHGPKAPEIVNPSGFINTNDENITIGQFKGKKVVLLDVWTYSCINCQRTLPYVKSWYEKYKDKGLVVIGLHTPEFGFEKVKSNVEDATKRFDLTYPIVMDNDYSTWTAYGNKYWPRKYLISGNGEIIYDHIGEGNYDETEKAIQQALSELNQTEIDVPMTNLDNVISVDTSKVKSPEIYFGASRNEYFGNGRFGVLGEQNLSLPNIISTNLFYLSGMWNFYREYAVSEGPGKIVFKYNSKNVYMVASSNNGINISISIDGKKVNTVFIKENRLYDIIQGLDYGEHTLEIDFNSAGLNIFTFTFG